MTLADSQRAIGAMTRLLADHLIRRSFVVSVGRPERASQSDTAAKLNLYLYETELDGSMRNVWLDEGRPAPLWLTLKYLLTAFDDSESSDSAAAHELLGRGAAALHDLNFLRLDASTDLAVRAALENNPEPAKITFDSASSDLIARLMQGSEERYRLSMAFQVRPVMLVPDEPPAFALLVGVDYAQAPQQIIGADGVRIDAMPSLGPRLSEARPAGFEPGDVVRLFGADLHLSGLECVLGTVPLRIIGQAPDRLDVEVESSQPSTIAGGGLVSAGEHPLFVRRLLPGGRTRSSNLLIGALRPVVQTAAFGGGALQITGQLLGREDDDILVVLQGEHGLMRLFEGPALAGDQTTLNLAGVAAALTPGRYRVILQVNGQQARISPLIVVS
jgi:hypothetical protein